MPLEDGCAQDARKDRQMTSGVSNIENRASSRSQDEPDRRSALARTQRTEAVDSACSLTLGAEPQR